MKITYYGHPCFSVEANGKHLLFDPYITPNELASAINVDAIKADYIFISHAITIILRMQSGSQKIQVPRYWAILKSTIG